MPAEIKQCPFCGGQAEVLYGSGVDLMTQDNRPYVGCPTCHFCIHEETIREALVVWNRRADTKEVAPSASTNSQRDEILRRCETCACDLTEDSICDVCFSFSNWRKKSPV
jgi:hypothetical protein